MLAVKKNFFAITQYIPIIFAPEQVFLGQGVLETLLFRLPLQFLVIIHLQQFAPFASVVKSALNYRKNVKSKGKISSKMTTHLIEPCTIDEFLFGRIKGRNKLLKGDVQ